MGNVMIWGSGGRRLAVLLGALASASAVLVSISSHPAQAGGVPDGWTLQQGPGLTAALSCPDSTHCWAVGPPAGSSSSGGSSPPPARVGSSTDGGDSWTTLNLTGSLASVALVSVSCPDESHCWAVGTTAPGSDQPVVITTADGGATWTAQTIPPPTAGGLLTGVSCAGDQHCVAVGRGGASGGPSGPYSLTTSDGGQTWTQGVSVPPGQAGFSAVSCPSASICYSTVLQGSSQPGIDYSSDGGATWSVSLTEPQLDLPLGSLSCPAVTQCMVVNPTQNSSALYIGGVSTSGQSGWRLVQAPGGASAVACPDTQSCRLVGYDAAWGTHDFGQSWSRDQITYTVQQLSAPNPTAMSCPTVFHCVALGTERATYGGGISPAVSISLVTNGGGAFPGYWLSASDGGIFTFGSAGFHGSTGNLRLNSPVVDMAPTVDGRGYWLAAADGGVFTFGDASFDGSMGGKPIAGSIVAIVDNPGYGYSLVSSEGAVYGFGSRPLSNPPMHLASPVVGAALIGNAFWLVTAKGQVVSLSNEAPNLGDASGLRLARPIVGMAATPDGGGYWLVASDGGIFSYGDAKFYGSTGAIRLNKPIVGMAAPDSGGYWLVASDGGIFTFGDANFYGSTGAMRLNKPIVGMG